MHLHLLQIRMPLQSDANFFHRVEQVSCFPKVLPRPLASNMKVAAQRVDPNAMNLVSQPLTELFPLKS